MTKLLLTDRALSDIDAIEHYSVERWGTQGQDAVQHGDHIEEVAGFVRLLEADLIGQAAVGGDR